MRISAIIFILLCLNTVVDGQWRQKKHPEAEQIKDPISNTSSLSADTIYLRMYKNGMKYGDFRLAITALHGMLAIHPENVNYLDSLSILYAQTQNYSQCIFTGLDVLKSMPDNVPVISAMAVSYQQVGRYQEALALYKKEYSKNSSLYAAYQISVLQYALKNYGEAQASLDRLRLDPKAATDKINFSTSSNSSQMVLYKAAAENLMGIIYQDLKDYENASKSFKKALEIQPDFVLAQNNLDYLTKNIDTQTKDNPSDGVNKRKSNAK